MKQSAAPRVRRHPTIERATTMDSRDYRQQRCPHGWVNATQCRSCAIKAENDLRRDAERYRWLRVQYWDAAEICAVQYPKVAVKPGHCCLSGDMLDVAVDGAMYGR